MWSMGSSNGTVAWEEVRNIFFFFFGFDETIFLVILWLDVAGCQNFVVYFWHFGLPRMGMKLI
jgi:hypothetical protein